MPLRTQSLLNDEVFRTALVGILVKRLGGVVTLTQADFDDISTMMLLENVIADGSLKFSVMHTQ